LLVELTTPSSRAAEADAGAAAESAAERIAAQGYELQATGRYAEAIAAYVKAYELSGAAAALFNVATIYDRRLRDRALAAEYYRDYVGAPDAEPALVERANARLAAMKRDEEAEAGRAAEAGSPASTSPIAEPSPAPAAMPTVAPPASAPVSVVAPPHAANGAPWRTAGFVVGAVGVASVGASLMLGTLALVKSRDADAVCNGAVCSGEDGVRLAQESGHLATASTITFFAGLALVGGGLTMILAAPKGSAAATGRRVTVALSPAANPSFAGLDLRGRF
jgi:hypothetical protein